MSKIGKQTAKRKKLLGKSGLWALLAILLIGLIVWTVLRFGSGDAPSDPGLEAPPTNTHQAAPVSPEAGFDPNPDRAVETIGRVETDPLPYRDMPKVFDGTGMISGEVFPAQSLAFPEKWTLRIRPSRFAMGKQMAIEKDLTFEGNQTTFEVRDLPMAGYTVQAVAENQATRPIEISLFRIRGGAPTAQKKESRVVMRFEPLARAHIRLQTSDLMPASDVPVIMEYIQTGDRFDGLTDARGEALLQDLPEGNYQLFVGNAVKPLIPAEEVMVLQRSHFRWEGQLPPSEGLLVRVLDQQSRPLPEAEITGHGPVPIQAQTDFSGEVQLNYLPHGTYQIRATHAASETKGRATVIIPHEVPTDAMPKGVVVIRCKP